MHLYCMSFSEETRNISWRSKRNGNGMLEWWKNLHMTFFAINFAEFKFFICKYLRRRIIFRKWSFHSTEKRMLNIWKFHWLSSRCVLLRVLFTFGIRNKNATSSIWNSFVWNCEWYFEKFLNILFECFGDIKRRQISYSFIRISWFHSSSNRAKPSQSRCWKF